MHIETSCHRCDFREECEKNRGRVKHCNMHSILVTQEGHVVSYKPFALFEAIHELLIKKCV